MDYIRSKELETLCVIGKGAKETKDMTPCVGPTNFSISKAITVCFFSGNEIVQAFKAAIVFLVIMGVLLFIVNLIWKQFEK